MSLEMPTELFFLNSKERRKFYSTLETSYGLSDFSIFDDYDVLSRRKDEVDRIFLLKLSVSEIPLDNVRIDSLGLFFCEISENEVKLSIEGSNFIGLKCSKNVLDLDLDVAKRYMSGEDISVDFKDSQVIVKSGTDFLGSSFVKNNVLINNVPKERRLGAII
ncbi:hypothetical protein JXM83_07445 [Candidatus Woesearchaeota archaeon]|nr:hypothetical protein [Candidatus Woesearchaeota archaeon]